jgi:hypothetical protein
MNDGAARKEVWTEARLLASYAVPCRTVLCHADPMFEYKWV